MARAMRLLLLLIVARAAAAQQVRFRIPLDRTVTDADRALVAAAAAEPGAPGIASSMPADAGDAE
jgi:hypothetical protein